MVKIKLWLILSSLLSLIIVIHCAHITSFTAPALVKIGETFMINCNFSMGPDERLESIIFSKDKPELIFYRYNESTKTHDTSSVFGINYNQVHNTKDYFGKISVVNAKLETRGAYYCTVNTRFKGAPTTVSQVTHIATTNGSQGITDLYAPKRVNKGDNYWINCTFKITPEMGTFLSLNISKDNKYFYNFTNNPVNQSLSPILGINMNQIEAFKDIPGCVRIINASMNAYGVYNCSLSWIIDKEVRSIYRARYVSFGLSQPQINPYFEIIFIILGLGFSFVVW